MKKMAGIIVLLIFAGLIGYKVYVKINETQSFSQQEWGRHGDSAGVAAVVQVYTVKAHSIREVLNLVGSIVPETEVSIQPMLSGRLISLWVEEGQFVKAGSVVGEIDAESLRMQLLGSQATIAQIKSNVHQAEINVGKTKLERDRYQELLAKKYVSQSAYDGAEAAYRSALAAQEGAHAQLSAAEKNYGLLEIQMRNTRIIAPISGYILKKYATPGSNLTTGSTIATVVPLNLVKLSFRVDQTQAAKVRQGMTANFTPDVMTGETTFQGVIGPIIPSYDTQSRTLELTANLNNSEQKLLPGMFGEVEIILGTKENALAVPEEALVKEGGGQGVFIVDRSGSAKFQPVSVGLSAAGEMEILSGLKDGDRVVVVGQNRLRDGEKVHILGEGKGNREIGGRRDGHGRRRGGYRRGGDRP